MHMLLKHTSSLAALAHVNFAWFLLHYHLFLEISLFFGSEAHSEAAS